MTSKNHSELLDLERDLPTTAEDIEALRRAPMPDRDFASLMIALARLSFPAALLRQRPTHAGFEPFVL